MISKLSNDIIDYLINYFNNEENTNKIKSNVIDPLIIYIFDKFYPFFLICGFIFILIFLLVLSIFIMFIYNLK
jgi:hypothetical protein